MRRAMLILCLLAAPSLANEAKSFAGKHFSGAGDVEYLELLDTARRQFEPDPHRQSVHLLYEPKWNGLVEGPTWDAWWIQNSYGTTSRPRSVAGVLAVVGAGLGAAVGAPGSAYGSSIPGACFSSGFGSGTFFFAGFFAGFFSGFAGSSAYGSIGCAATGTASASTIATAAHRLTTSSPDPRSPAAPASPDG